MYEIIYMCISGDLLEFVKVDSREYNNYGHPVKCFLINVNQDLAIYCQRFGVYYQDVGLELIYF